MEPVEPVGATTPPEVVFPVLAPVGGVTVPAPPLVEPVEGVVLAGVLVCVLVAGVVVPVVAGTEAVEVVLADELLVTIDVDAVEEVAPVAPVAPLDPVELALSSLL